MTQFFTELGRMKELENFAGGNATQCAKLNAMVDRLNDIVKLARRCGVFDKLLALLDGMEIRVSYAEENGEVVTYNILAQKINDIVG